jgi:hypothetical protein
MATYDFQLEAGALIRKQVLFEFRAAASKAGLTFELLADDGGWLSTTYLARVTGTPEAVTRYAGAVKSWAEKMKSEEKKRT